MVYSRDALARTHSLPHRLLLPATASARPQSAFFNSIIPTRVDHLIGFTPTTFAIHPAGTASRTRSPFAVGGRRYRYIFDNAAAAVGPSANIYMKNMLRDRRYPSPQGIFLDRKLKRAEKRYLRSGSTSPATLTCWP